MQPDVKIQGPQLKIYLFSSFLSQSNLNLSVQGGIGVSQPIPFNTLYFVLFLTGVNSNLVPPRNQVPIILKNVSSDSALHRQVLVVMREQRGNRKIVSWGPESSHLHHDVQIYPACKVRREGSQIKFRPHNLTQSMTVR